MTIKDLTLNGWQRAALLLAGIAIAAGTYAGADLRGVAWIVPALVATALVVFSLKGLSRGQGAVVAVAIITGALATGVRGLDERDQRNRIETMGTQRAAMFNQMIANAIGDVIKSGKVRAECVSEYNAELAVVYQARLEKEIASELAAGNSVEWMKSLGTVANGR